MGNQNVDDNLTDRIPAHNRVSIRAVLVPEGKDPHAALAAAGIVDAVAIPVVIGDASDLGGGILGDGITPNLVGVLETRQDAETGQDGQDDHGVSSPKPGIAGSAMPIRPASGPVTGTMPAAYGIQPLAPVRRTR